MRILCCIALGLGTACLALPAQGLEKKSIEAVRADTPPVIDGVLDDEVWEGAPEATGFTDTRINQPAAKQTIVRVLYDDDFLYVGAECIQDPTNITATSRKYDQDYIRQEDYFQVAVDTFHDLSRAYLFLVSPLGTRYDARDGLFGRPTSTWDAVWNAASTIGEDRWYAEMAIPLGDMDLNREKDQTWGIQFRRSVSSDDERSHWNYNVEAGVSNWARGPKAVADFGVITGLDLSNVNVVRRPEIETYVAATTLKRDGGEHHTRLSSGADLSLRINSHWVGTFTVNPDYGEIAADEGDVQNRDTPRFLQERRTFFSEGHELFRTPINVFDTRKFADIDAAAKISGTGKDWTNATLLLRGFGTRSGEADFLVSRYTKSFGDKIQVGGIFAMADRDNGYNFVTGPDLRLKLSNTVIWSTQYLRMFDEQDVYEESVSSDGELVVHKVHDRKDEHAFTSRLEGGKKPLFWSVNLVDISPDFEPDLAFIRRQDIRGASTRIRYDKEMDRGHVEAYEADIRAAYYLNHDNRTVLRDFRVEAGVDLANDWDIQLGRDESFHDPYDNRRNEIRIDYKRQDIFRSFDFRFAWGEFEEVQFEEVQFKKPFKFNGRWVNNFQGTFRREDQPGNDEDVWLWRYESEYTFPWDGRVKLTWEEGSNGEHARVLLFAYEDIGDWDFYIVLNDFRTNGDDERRERSAFAKFVYRW